MFQIEKNIDIDAISFATFAGDSSPIYQVESYIGGI